MLNQTVLVGRLTSDPEVRETDSGKKVASITLAVPRGFKNTNGEYDTDFIPCVLWSGVAESAAEYCHKGDLVGLRGRIQSRKIEIDEDKKRELTEVIVDKLTFLSSKKNNQEEQS